MEMLFTVMAAVLVTGVVIVTAGLVLRRFLGYRGEGLVECPETGRPAGVRLSAWRATHAAIQGESDLRLTDCTRWPERRNCGQECLARIESAPEDCLVRNILEDWFEGRVCRFCRRPVGLGREGVHKPALLVPEGSQARTIDWQDVRAEQLPALLNRCEPVCWDCHVVLTFRREHPDLVTDRPHH